MKFAIKHLWSSLRDLATQSPILLALIAIFSCTPLYIEQDWFAEIDIKLYSLYFFIVILQSYITRARKFSILYTLVKYRNQHWSLYDSRNVRVCAGH